MSNELRKAWKEVLFWAERCSRSSSASHPEWFKKLEAAIARRDCLKDQDEKKGRGV